VRIKPSTAIRQDYTGFAELCHSIDEPVVLTRNGEADLVVMSYEAFQRREARASLQAKLLVADQQSAGGEPLHDPADVFARIRERIDVSTDG
jgi:PHD/YefM family antitoxin component YafN of YafNO toxin-antitoxin module